MLDAPNTNKRPVEDIIERAAMLFEVIKREFRSVLKVQDCSHRSVMKALESGNITLFNLRNLKSDYDKWSESDKSKCSWEDLKSRLFANEGRYLTLASSMVNGGVLFGTDSECNPLISDRCSEPLFKDLNLADAKQATCGDADNPTGYEMFSLSRPEEIETFEKFMGIRFVQPDSENASNDNTWDSHRSSWVDNDGASYMDDCSDGETRPANTVFTFVNDNGSDPKTGTYVCYEKPDSSAEWRGVRRLLRLNKNY